MGIVFCGFCDAYVFRQHRNGNNAMAKPCPVCMAALKEVGIRKVYYIVDDNIICENVKDMISIQSSSAVKHTDKLLNINNFSSINDYYINLLKKQIPNYIKYNNLFNTFNNFINIGF